VASMAKDQPFPPFKAFRAETLVAAVAARLSATAQAASRCRACVLSTTRKAVVFGAGTARSGVVFIGEAPGKQEDEQGVPFVGRSGRVLDEMLAKIGIQRDDVYICNVIKCRPPSNRDPRPEETTACAHFLRAQLDAVRPRALCALGLHAARWLLSTHLPMAELRGRIVDYNGVPTLATYHPAALLRNPKLKTNAWEDFKRLRSIVEEVAAREAQ